MNEEDRKLILEWCGGIFYPYKHPTILFSLPTLHHSGKPLNPNFYFKYAVPKLDEWCIKSFCGRCEVELYTEGIGRFRGISENPAEAFGEALLKLIKAEK